MLFILVVKQIYNAKEDSESLSKRKEAAAYKKNSLFPVQLSLFVVTQCEEATPVIQIKLILKRQFWMGRIFGHQKNENA